MIVTLKHHSDESFEIVAGVRQIGRIRTDKPGCCNRAGWILFEMTGCSMVFDDLTDIVNVEEEKL